MASESRLLFGIFALLVALIAVPLFLLRVKESRRPVLEEVRIVTANAGDSVFRSGSRSVAPDGGLEIAAAVRIRTADDGEIWMSPVERLEIDGAQVVHRNDSAWPDDERVLRVFWFTIESSYLGGDLTVETAEKFLNQRSYFAPEMGRGLRADAIPEQHNDDQINLGDEDTDHGGGTIRLYAKVEVAEKADSLASDQSAASPGAGDAFDPGFTVIRMAAEFPAPISSTLGELFRLPGFEPQPNEAGSWEDITLASRGESFSDLVDRRFVVSSWTFASVALTGGLGLTRDALEGRGRVAFNDGAPTIAGRAASWGEDIIAGDLLEDRGQFIVLLSDDGDGVLGPTDQVAHCWRRPAVVTTLDQAILDDAVEAEFLRYVR
jgi:hypothetical protein